MGNIEEILNDFQKKFGIAPKPRKDLEVFPTGFQQIDDALEIEGIPKGKTTEISGAPGVGKSILSYYIMKNAQERGAIVLYVDTDRAFNANYAKKIGVDTSQLLICTPQTGEIAMQVIYYYLSYYLIDLVVIDSVPALLSLEELSGTTKNGVQRKLITSMMKELVGIIEDSKVALLCINQVRHCFRTGKEITPFNSIFGYYASLRIHLSRVKTLKKWRTLKGYVVEANIYKNRWSGRKITNFELPIITRGFCDGEKETS